jgi:hypothetical protein
LRGSSRIPLKNDHLEKSLNEDVIDQEKLNKAVALVTRRVVFTTICFKYH